MTGTEKKKENNYETTAITLPHLKDHTAARIEDLLIIANELPETAIDKSQKEAIKQLAGQNTPCLLPYIAGIGNVLDKCVENYKSSGEPNPLVAAKLHHATCILTACYSDIISDITLLLCQIQCTAAKISITDKSAKDITCLAAATVPAVYDMKLAGTEKLKTLAKLEDAFYAFRTGTCDEQTHKMQNQLVSAGILLRTII